MQRNSNNFCGTCQKVDRKVCTQRENLLRLYENGEWTENSEMIRPKEWTKWAWDYPAQSSGNSSILRQAQFNNPDLINYGNMLYPSCTGQGLSRELYQNPNKTNSADITELCGPQYPLGVGSLPCQTPNSMCHNSVCYNNSQNCKQPQGLSQVVELPNQGCGN